MISRSIHSVLVLLACDEKVRKHLYELLRQHKYNPVIIAVPDDLRNVLRGSKEAILLLDSRTVQNYGEGIYEQLASAYPGLRIILCCAHVHRDLIRTAMESGTYGCILEPYAEWEVLTMLKHLPVDASARKGGGGKRRS